MQLYIIWDMLLPKYISSIAPDLPLTRNHSKGTTMKTIEECTQSKMALEEILHEASAERDRLIQLKPPHSSLHLIQSWQDAIDQYESRLALIPQAMKYRRELLDPNLDNDRREFVLSMIALEPNDLFNLTYRLKMSA